MVRDGVEPVIGPRYAWTRWRLLTMRVEQSKAANYTQTKPRPEGTPGGACVRSYLAHIRMRGARTDRSGY